MGEAQDLWNRVSDILRAQVSEAVWLSSVQVVRPVSFDGHRLVLAVSSPLVKDRLDGRYAALIRDALGDAGFVGVDVAFEVVAVEDGPHPPPAERTPTPAPAPAADAATAAPSRDTRPNGSRLTVALNPRYTFEAFVTGASNRFAHAAALSVAETPAQSYNPLFIYGAAGLGKTHLLHAIAHYVRQNYPGHKVGYLSTEVFTNEFIDAIRTNTTTAFKRRYREMDVLLIDDIQFLENKEGTQEEFFHTFNSLHGSNRQIVISSDRQPDAIATLEDRLRSRFKWGLITDIQPPDLETRLAILRKKADRDETSRVPDDVLGFIASRITDNIRVLEGALIRVSAYASLNNEPLTPDLAERVLGDILTERQPRPITPAVILEATAKMFGFTVDEIKDRSRRRPLVTARQVGMYVCRELTDLSYPAIAREFGGRDHTTVIHAVEKIGALMKERRQIYNQVTELMQIIQASD